MARKYEVYDERGRKIGEAREEPSTIEQAVGVFILLWLVWELLKAIIELVVLSIKIVIEYPRQALALFMIVALLVLFFIWYRGYSEYRAEQAEVFAFQTQATQTAEIIHQRQAQAASLFETPVAQLSTSNTTIDVNSVTSYRIRSTFIFSGSAYESETIKRVEMVAEYTKEPLAVRVIMKLGDYLVEIVHIGDTEWFINSGVVLGKESSKSPPVFSEGLVILELSDLSRFYVDTRVLDKFRVNHYTVGKEDHQLVLTLLDSTNDPEKTLHYVEQAVEQANDFRTDIYTLDNGLLIKYEMHIEGNINPDKPDLPGILIIKSELYDFNVPINIKPPN